MQFWEVLLAFFIIAAIYASVGFGGGSSYLALLSLYAMPFKEMRFIALVCNIIVVTGGTFIYIRNRQVNWKKILPLALASVPLAFLGAIIKLSQDTFFVILGVSLIIAAVLLWIKPPAADAEGRDKPAYVRDGIIGGAIGFLSGMVGIGGGIFLSPLLHLLKWDGAKKIAATASVFILVNSISGIIGQLIRLPAEINFKEVLYLGLAVLAGGQLGSRLGALRFNPLTIRRLTALLVFAAGVEVLIRHLHGQK